MVKKRKIILSTVLLASVSILIVGRVYAQPYSSSNYSLEEARFGTGGELDTGSSSFQAQASIGNIGVGDVSSTNYRAVAGSITPSEEYLEFVVTQATIDLGVLSTGSTAYGSGTFYVRSYVATGYTVITASQPPDNGSGDTLAPMASAASPSPGTEQFGINLVANTSPASFGSNPAPQPSGAFAYGAAASGYDTANNYKYVVGDTVATSPKGIGQTNYTVSYIANIAPLTEAGLYTMDHVLVATPTF